MSKRKGSANISGQGGKRGRNTSAIREELLNEEAEERSAFEGDEAQEGEGSQSADNNSDKPKQSTKRIPVLLRSKYFKIKKGPFADDKVKVQCMLCVNKILKGKITSTGNFRKHIEGSHKAEYNAMLAEVEKMEKEEKKPGSKARTSTSPAPPIDKYIGRQSSCVTQAQANTAIVGFIVDEMEPVAKTESPSLRNMVEVLTRSNPVPIYCPSRKTANSIIAGNYDQMMTDMKKDLQDATYVSTTADIWSKRNRSYMGVTAHTISMETLARVSYAVACKRIKYSHNFKNIATVLNSVHKELGIEKKGKIVNCITDNASNFAKAFRIFSPDNASTANLETDDIDNEDEDDEVVFPDIEFSNEHFADDDVDFLSDDFVPLPPQKRCFAHTLSLIMTTDCDLKNISNTVYKRLYTSAFSKVKAFWKLGNKSTKASDYIVDVAGVKFPVPNKTRWNAYPDAIAKLLEKRDILDEAFDTLKVPKLKNIELEFFEEYKKVTEPIATGLDVLQGDKYCHFGLALPTLLVINKNMDAMRNLVHCAPLHAMIKEGLQKRFGHIMDINNVASEEYLIASISLPQFKLHFLNNSPYTKAQINRARNLFIEACEVAQRELEDEEDSEMLSNVKETEDNKKSNANEMPRRVADFFVDLQVSPVAQAQKSENTARLEALTYLEDKEQKYEMLHKYKIVKRVFFKYNVSLPSSAPVERMFSTGGQILTPRRGRLGDDNFEMQLLLKANRYYATPSTK